ncbi:MAG: carboxypeptidase-like regulatory domain-containing protein [Acidobacteriota bacterium]|nr:carboxypeptidase-like regulatory domain-containing protein [Acidobacteriota bacterium]
MRRYRALALLAALTVVTIPAQSATAPLPSALQVLGTVTTAARPVGNALVIALNLQDLGAVQAWTASDGSFELPKLAAGIYRIIAVKQGFAPAITTLIPTQASHRVSLKLETEKQAKRKDVNQQIWELRGSLPPDVLRDLELVLQPEEVATYEIPRFKGEMVSLTGVTNTAASTAYAQTALGVQGRITDKWQVGIRGNLQRFEDPTDDVSFGSPVAESSVMSMELRSSPTTSYRVASTKSTWMFADGGEGAPQQADVRAHNFEFENGPARVQVRYFQQANLFQNESNLIEVATAMPLMQTRRNDLGVAVRVTQESVSSHRDALRVADVAANGSVHVVPSVVVHYGMASRIGVEGQEWAPRTGAEWKLTENTSIVGSLLYKVLDRDVTTLATPSLVFWSDEAHVLPRYAYTVGIVSGKEGKNRFSALATVSAADQPLRVVFADEGNQFWDGLQIDAGDVRRDVRLAYRREMGKLALDVAATAGTAAQRTDLTHDHAKVYITGDLQSTFTPTRTSLAVSYREIQQPGEGATDDYRTERLHLRMAQSLYLPVDIKLLLGLEVAHAENSPYLIDAFTSEGTSRKYIGGLAVNF